MADLPDFYSYVESAVGVATSLQSGADAAKSSSPTAGDVYLATDTSKLYVCYASGSWTHVTAAYLLLAGGTMTGAIAMGDNKITGLGTPTAGQDAATKTYVDLFTLLTTFNDHSARHEDTGDDEISLAGLSGEPADTVNKTGNQTIAGIKTFSSIPLLPASDPTADNEAARKAYVDAFAPLAFTELFSSVHVADTEGAWEDWDISAIIPTGCAAVEVAIEKHANGSVGARADGSALARLFSFQFSASTEHQPVTVTVPIGATRVIEIYDSVQSSNPSNFYIIGYWS